MHSNVKWLIEEIREDCTDFLRLKEALIKLEYEFEITKPYKWKNCSFTDSDCVVFCGSLHTAKDIMRNSKWYPATYYSQTDYKCSFYYPKYNDLLLNKEYMMFPYGDVLKKKDFIFNTYQIGDIFIRPDRGDKSFTGHIIGAHEYEERINDIDSMNIPHNDIILVAPAYNIIREWRFLCVNGKICDGSLYKENDEIKEEHSYSIEAIQKAQQTAEQFNLAPVYIIDICETENNEFHLLELGCFNCAGLYSMDRNLVVKTVSDAVWEDWLQYQSVQ